MDAAFYVLRDNNRKCDRMPILYSNTGNKFHVAFLKSVDLLVKFLCVVALIFSHFSSRKTLSTLVDLTEYFTDESFFTRDPGKVWAFFTV